MRIYGIQSLKKWRNVLSIFKRFKISDYHPCIPTFQYQSSIEEYVSNEIRMFEILQDRIDRYAGGFSGKVVLEVGTGIHMPHGGSYCALAALAGAKQVFGIDIGHPWPPTVSSERLSFWRMFLEQIPELSSIGCQISDRVIFVPNEASETEYFSNRVEFLQMNASKMYFRDQMFDLVFSKAVFEHLKKPREALMEIWRVLKKGGYALITWNPFTSLRMGGHDIGIPTYYPWAHLRLSKEEHVNKLREVYSNKALYEKLPAEHRPTDEQARRYAADPSSLRQGILEDLNQIRISEFLQYVEETGFQIVWSQNVILEEDWKYLTEQIRKELFQYSEEELLMVCMEIVLVK